jgi:integrase
MKRTAKPFEPFVFLRRGRIWTIVYPGPGGTKKQKATTFKGPEGEAKARKALEKFTAWLKSSQLIEGNDGAGEGPMTVARWAPIWLATREARGISTVDDYRSILKNHVLPHIGPVRIDKVTHEHIEEVMRHAATSGLAPRTQRHVYGTMHAMFNRAMPRLLDKNPCAIHRDELPQKKDADPEWRPTAIFSREEVQTIVTSPEIPADRRVFYAVMFLSGLRFGEIAALKVRHYRPEVEPLGQLQVGRSYNSKKAKLKGVKTDRPRLVPVHQWLAQILGWWLAVGWQEMMGRPPEEDDVLLPTKRGTHRSCSTGWRQMNGHGPKKDRGAQAGDLERLGMRSRRQHDTRRTFITLARADGARKDLLRLVTHGPEGDIVDIYTEMPWGALCEEVAKLKLAPPAPKPLGVVPNPAISLEPGLPLGCHGRITERTQEVTMRPQRDSNPDKLPGQATPANVTGSKSAPALGRSVSERQAVEANDGQTRPMATLATLALRQALVALRTGRVDQAIEIIERAVADEAAEARRVGGGRS